MVLGGWSIGLEYVFYLAFPLLLLLSRHALLRYGVTLALLLAAYPYTFGKVQAAPASDTFHTYVQIPNHAFLFMLGALLVDLRSRVRARLPAWAMPVVLVVALAGLFAQGTQVFDHLDVMVGFKRVGFVSACFALVLAFAFARLSERAWFGVPALLGKLSYSVYLLHPFAWVIVRKLFPGMSPTTSVVVGLVATLSLSALVYHLCEQPLLRLGQTLASKLKGKVRTSSEAEVAEPRAASQTQAT
jgi:peptidoglycan/LPS O-acetylase OafA/YrhL